MVHKLKKKKYQQSSDHNIHKFNKKKKYFLWDFIGWEVEVFEES